MLNDYLKKADGRNTVLELEELQEMCDSMV
jgi:hypothetical protein